jgi:hypothetical protein
MALERPADVVAPTPVVWYETSRLSGEAGHRRGWLCWRRHGLSLGVSRTLSRRSFLRSTAALGALAATGLLRPRPALGVSTWVSPASIDNAGRQNVSSALTDWLATTGQDGDVLKLRRGPGDAPGRYWIPQGVAIRRPLQLDLNGCTLYTGAGDGSDHPPLYDDHTPHRFAPWPERRYCLSVVASQVRVFSSEKYARIQGGTRDANVDSLGEPYGCVYHPDLESQAGIRSDGYHNLYDLTNVSIEFVHGDGIEIVQGSRAAFIVGRNLGAPVRDNLGGTLSGSSWEPGDTIYPGIHHTGRHGISTADCDGLVIHGISAWHTGRATVDLEPGSANDIVNNVRISKTESGRHRLNWLAVAGRVIDNLVVTDNICHSQITVSTGDATVTTPRHANWQILRNRGGQVYKGLKDGCFTVARVDGLLIRDNFQLVNGRRPEMGIRLGSSTDVTVDPGEDVQFPVA